MGAELPPLPTSPGDPKALSFQWKDNLVNYIYQLGKLHFTIISFALEEVE